MYLPRDEKTRSVIENKSRVNKTKSVHIFFYTQTEKTRVKCSEINTSENCFSVPIGTNHFYCNFSPFFPPMREMCDIFNPTFSFVGNHVESKQPRQI